MNKKLSKPVNKLLTKTLKTAQLIGVEKLIIDNMSIRGESPENGTLLLLKFPDDTEFEFGAMGISRVNELSSRMKLLDDDGDIIPEYKERDNGDKFVFKMNLKKNRTSVEFKCADPNHIRAPKNFNDPETYHFSLSNEDIKTIISAKRILQSDNCSFVCNDTGEISFNIIGIEGDKMVHTIGASENTDFTFTYKNKIILPVLNEISDLSEVDVVITKRGIIKLVVNEIPVYIFPEV